MQPVICMLVVCVIVDSLQELLSINLCVYVRMDGCQCVIDMFMRSIDMCSVIVSPHIACCVNLKIILG